LASGGFGFVREGDIFGDGLDGVGFDGVDEYGLDGEDGRCFHGLWKQEFKNRIILKYIYAKNSFKYAKNSFKKLWEKILSA
jgi:hypothetical protein